MTRLVVEVADLVDASRGMDAEIAGRLEVAAGILADALFDSDGMAGTDPAGTSWAKAYDPAASTTLDATAAAINGCYRLSAMFAQTARNYAAADRASTAGVTHAISADVARLPTPTTVSFAPPPSAWGGTIDPPIGWSLIQHAVGYVWPNGYQDQLRAAADAWTASAHALADRGDCIGFTVIRSFIDGLPEFDDMHTVCMSMGDHLHALARAHRAIAQACRELAHLIDELHSKVEHELVELGVETAGIQVIGAILASVTAGAAELPTQSVQTERILAVARTVKDLIDTYISLARTAVAELPVIKALTENIQILMDRLAANPLMRAAMEGVPGLPASAQAGQASRSGEILADRRLAQDARDGVRMAKSGDGGIAGASSRPGQLAGTFKCTNAAIRQAIHDVKDAADFPGNPDVVVDRYGEVFPVGKDGVAGDSIGNILDYLGD